MKADLEADRFDEAEKRLADIAKVYVEPAEAGRSSDDGVSDTDFAQLQKKRKAHVVQDRAPRNWRKRKP